MKGKTKTVSPARNGSLIYNAYIASPSLLLFVIPAGRYKLSYCITMRFCIFKQHLRRAYGFQIPLQTQMLQRGYPVLKGHSARLIVTAAIWKI